MDPKISIDLTQDWDLFHFSDNDLPKNQPFMILSPQEKGLVEGAGFLILPSARINSSTSKDNLSDTTNRNLLATEITTGGSTNGVLGLLSFKEDYAQKLIGYESEAIENPDAEIYDEEVISLTFSDEIEILSDFDVDLRLYDTDLKNQTAIEIATASNIQGAELDIISLVKYYDENGIHVYEDLLIPESVDNLNENGIHLNLRNSIVQKEIDVIAPVRFKKVKIVIRKVIGKIRKTLISVKGFAIDQIHKALRLIIKDRYEILKYDFTDKTFKLIAPSKDSKSGLPLIPDPRSIDPSLKTLIILHGTLKGSFSKGLFKRENKQGSYKYLYFDKFKENSTATEYDHWFEFLTANKGEIDKYEQIICLEHETLLDSPQDNIREFESRWGSLLNFEHPVSVITASRGSLIAKYISNDKSQLKTIPIERVAIVSGGYSGYLDSKRGVKVYLKIALRLFSINPQLRFLLSLTLDVITGLPGLDALNEQSKRYKDIVTNPTSNSPIVYLNMVNDFDPGNHLLWKAAKGFSVGFLTAENDILLSKKAQEEYRPGRNHVKFPPYYDNKKHGDGLSETDAKLVLHKFLTANLDKPL